MKKIILAVAILAFISPTFAQTFNLGIKASINSQKITTDSYNGISSYSFSDFKSDAKMVIMLALLPYRGNKLYLQPELLYSIRKGNTNLTLATTSGDLTAGFIVNRLI